MNQKVLYQWTEEIRKHLPSLNSWQITNVALLSYGVIKAESSQQPKIARQIRVGEKVASAARRIRRFVSNGGFPLAAFWVEWVGWVVSALGMKQLTVLVDETKIRDRVAAMVVGEGRCLPLVWRLYTANAATAYPSEGQVGLIADLLSRVKAGLPDGVRVLVLADRGIGCSPGLCQAVAALGWQYLFRLTCQTKVVTQTGEYTIAAMVQPGELWSESGLVFKRRGHIPAHARALWTVGYDEPWALVTNDEQLTGHEYARRAWQEQAFRDLKTGGWQWHQSHIRNPEHMSRLLVVLVVAYVWSVALGSQAVATQLAQPLIRRAGRRPGRVFSLFREGLDFLIQVVEALSCFVGLVFTQDARFT